MYMSKMIDLTGQKFGGLTAICRDDTKEKSGTYWLCECDCGKTTSAQSYDLRKGKVKSCGCYNVDKLTKHGESRTRLYSIWKTAKSRCLNRKDKDFYKYGARGKTMCEEWLGENGLRHFIEWSLENGYAENLTLDRINGNKGYSPTNCRWATMEEQQNNRSDNRLITYNGETHTIAQWARIKGVQHGSLLGRINHGWSAEEALTVPMSKKTEEEQKRSPFKRLFCLDKKGVVVLMGVKYKVESNFIPEIKANMKSMGARTVTIGALEGESAWLAGIHEY